MNLKQRIRDAVDEYLNGDTKVYSISKESGVKSQILYQFLGGQDRSISLDNASLLVDYFAARGTDVLKGIETADMAVDCDDLREAIIHLMDSVRDTSAKSIKTRDRVLKQAIRRVYRVCHLKLPRGQELDECLMS